MLKEKYGSMDNLKRLMEKDPENVLYPRDLEDWLYHLEHPDAEVKQSETIFVKDLKINMSDLKMLDIIKNQHLTSIRNLSCILHKDLKTVQPGLHRLREEGFIKLEGRSQKCQETCGYFLIK
jgi:hypothetical protein